MQLPGTLRRREGQPATGDPAVDEAYAALGQTYAFFWQVYQRDSIDDLGMPLIGSVHYGQGYENAFWNGEQMVFGDGDGDGDCSSVSPVRWMWSLTSWPTV